MPPTPTPTPPVWVPAVAGLAAVVAGGIDHWMVFNIGDSRVYRLAISHLEQLTVDHSEAEEMVLAGHITREEARTAISRNVVDPVPWH